MKLSIGNVDIFMKNERYNVEIKKEMVKCEKQLLEILRNHPEESEKDIMRSANQYPFLYHLCEERGYVTEIMGITEETSVLEIGSECGAVTSALLMRAGSVDCICTNQRHARINAYRHQEQQMRIYVGSVEDICPDHEYDVVTMIGSLSYATKYSRAERPFTALLQYAWDSLSPGGTLYVATENTLGMKFLAGTPYDASPIPYYNLQNYESATERSSYRTYTKSQIEKAIKSAGFTDLYFYYPYPDYKFPAFLFSEDMYMEPTYINAGQEYQYPRLSMFNESAAYINLSDADELKLLANSFLVEAKKQIGATS